MSQWPLGLVILMGTITGGPAPAEAPWAARLSRWAVAFNTSTPPKVENRSIPFARWAQEPSRPEPRELQRRLQELAREVSARGERAASGAPPRSTIVCGLTVFEADPSIDLKMIRSVPQDGRPDPKIRRVVPPVCTD